MGMGLGEGAGGRVRTRMEGVFGLREAMEKEKRKRSSGKKVPWSHDSVLGLSGLRVFYL